MRQGKFFGWIRNTLVIALVTALVAVFVFVSVSALAEEAVLVSEETSAGGFTAGGSDTDVAEGYILRTMVGGGQRWRGASVGSRLTGREKKLYDALESRILLVASGELTSAEFQIPVRDIYDDVRYSAEELGVSDLNSEENLNAATAAFKVKIAIDTQKVINALLADYPYDLYWFDKTLGFYQMGPTYTYSTYSSQMWLYNYSNNTITVKLYVSKGYSVTNATGTTDVNPTYGQAARDAAANARQIVENNRYYGDLAKLKNYKDAICALVSYNDAAAAGGVAFGDPWQLVWVFDGDEDTKVVCEGYSKAFQFLCDETSFAGNVRAISVSGTMSGGTGAGPHMWNIVRLNNGKNYLVDVTNSDTGTVGSRGELFLAGYTGTQVSDSGTVWYIYPTTYGGDILYCFNANTENLYAAEDLSAATQSYGGKTGACGENLYWETDEEGLLIVSGTGTALVKGDWTPGEMIVRAEIPEGIVSVADGTFNGCTELTSVLLPSSVESVGSGAFAGCSEDLIIHVYEGSDAAEALADSGLQVSIIGAPVSADGAEVIDKGSALALTVCTDEYADTLYLYDEEDTLLSSWTAAGSSEVVSGVRIWNVSRLFEQDRRYTLQIRSGRDGVPAGETLSYALNVVDPNYVVVNGVLTAYTGEDVSVFTVPGNLDVTGIGDGNPVFANGMETLTRVVVPDGVTAIGADAFSGCNGLVIEIPVSVTTIGNAGALGSGALARVYYNSDALQFCAANEIDYRIAGGLLSAQVADGIDRVALGEHVTLQGSMDKDANTLFVYDEAGLLGTYSLAECGAVYDDSGREGQWSWSVEVTPQRMGLYLYVNSGFSEAEEIGEKQVVQLAVHENGFVTGSGASGTVLRAYVGEDPDPVIPEGIVSLGDGLRGHTELTSVTLPTTLAELAEENFTGCTALETIRYPGSISGLVYQDDRMQLIGGILSISDDVEDGGLPELRSVSITVVTDVDADCVEVHDEDDRILSAWTAAASSISSGVTRTWTVACTPEEYRDTTLKIHSCVQGSVSVCMQEWSLMMMYAVDANGALIRCPRVGEVAIPEWLGVTALGDGLFSGADELAGITLPESLTAIGSESFTACNALEEIYIPAAVETIADDAFTDCDAVLIVEPGSYALEWAEANHQPCRIAFRWADLQTLFDGDASEITVILPADIAAETGDTFLTVPAGKTVTLDLNGHTIDRNMSDPYWTGYVLEIENGASLILQDSSAGGTGMITGDMCSMSGYACITNYGTFIMNGGTISGNYSGAVRTEGRFVLNGGTITGNGHTEPGSGGASLEIAVYVVRGTEFEMHGGAITNNLAAGVWNFGTMTMTDGEISGNGFGGLTNFENATATISGGTFSGNGWTRSNCGGISNRGNLSMTDVTISGNIGFSALEQSGEDGEMTLRDVEIINNQAKGISYTRGTLGISGKIVVEGNRSSGSSYDEDFYLYEGKVMTLTDALDADSRIGVLTYPYGSNYPSGTNHVVFTSGFFDENGNPRAYASSFVSDRGYIRVMKEGELAFASTYQFAMNEPDFVLPVELQVIEEEAFAGTGASVVRIPDGVTAIGSRAFTGCFALRQIEIPDSVTQIGEDVFDSHIAIVIFGTPGSCAQTYAEAHDNCEFICREGD